MPPRKRKQGVEQAVQQQAEAEQAVQQPSREEVARQIKEKLDVLDRAVEERCRAIAEAAQEIVEAFMQDFQIRLKTGIPKQLRETLWSDYAASRAVEPATAAEARVDSMLQEAQEAVAQTAAAGRTARAPRGRGARGAAGGSDAAEAPATARATRRGAAAAKQPVPKFEEGPAPDAAGGGAAAPESPSAGGARGGSGGGDENCGTATAAAAAASGAEARAQAKIDAKLAALGAAGAAGRRTVARGAMPGEQLYSARGSPLSVLPAANGRSRGAAVAAIGLTPAPAAVPANASSLGSFTLVKRGPPAAAGGGARGGARGRGRRREVVQPDTAAIMITTQDGQSFMVDGSAGSLAAIPDTHRAEVQQQLVTLQRLAASVLGASG